MRPSELLREFADRLTAKRVYSEPYREDGITIITAAAIRGGGGIREDTSDRERGGMGLMARPVGAYVMRDGRVVWKPAFDLSRIALRGQLVFTALVILGLVLNRRRALRMDPSPTFCSAAAVTRLPGEMTASSPTRRPHLL